MKREISGEIEERITEEVITVRRKNGGKEEREGGGREGQADQRKERT